MKRCTKIPRHNKLVTTKRKGPQPTRTASDTEPTITEAPTGNGDRTTTEVDPKATKAFKRELWSDTDRGPRGTEATEANEATEVTKATKAAEANETTKATEATEATEATKATKAS